jgi:hypothetical protein
MPKWVIGAIVGFIIGAVVTYFSPETWAAFARGPIDGVGFAIGYTLVPTVICAAIGAVVGAITGR